MAKSEFPFGFAVFSVRSGMSARAGLAAYRAGGGRVADATWHRMIGEARAQIAIRGDEVSRPLNRKPTIDEMTQWTTKTARGFAQQVNVIIKDRDTGLVQALPFTVTSRTLVQRQTAIERAFQHFTPEGTDGERQQILGAVYVGTMVMTPEG